MAINRRIMALCLAVFAEAAIAQGMTQTEAFEAGKSVDNQKIFDTVNEAKASEVIEGYNTNPPAQSSYWKGTATQLPVLKSGGSSKVVDCAGAGLNDPNPANSQHCQAVDALAKQPAKRPQGLLSKDDPLLLKGKGITANPDAIAGAIDGNYSECKTVTTTKESAFVMETCQDWSDNTKEACKIGQEIVVDPDYIYQCNETLKTINASTCTVGRIIKVDTKYNYQCQQTPQRMERQTCFKNLVVTCDPPKDGCDAGGVVPSNMQADMKLEWSYDANARAYTLFFGTQGNDYWATNLYDRKFTVNIVNKDEVKIFSLFHLEYDDWVMLKVNGQVIGTLPVSGDMLEYGIRKYHSYDDLTGSHWVTRTDRTVVRCQSWNPNPCGPAEMNQSNKVDGDIDLRPYLKNGPNIFETRTIVSGRGESWWWFRVRVACPQNCYESWDNQCQHLENRM